MSNGDLIGSAEARGLAGPLPNPRPESTAYIFWIYPPGQISEDGRCEFFDHVEGLPGTVLAMAHPDCRDNRFCFCEFAGDDLSAWLSGFYDYDWHCADPPHLLLWTFDFAPVLLTPETWRAWWLKHQSEDPAP